MKHKFLLASISLAFAVLTVPSNSLSLVISKQVAENSSSVDYETDEIINNENQLSEGAHYSVAETLKIFSKEFEKIADRQTKKTLGAINEISNFTTVNFLEFSETQGEIKKTVDTLARFHGIKINSPDSVNSETSTVPSSSRLTRRELIPEERRVNSPCGADPSWIPYNREKCYKIFDSIKTFEAASEECSEISPDTSSKLLTIQSIEEQEFISTLLFTKSGIVDNVWINGILNPNDKKFYTTDNTEVTTTYWANGAPTNISGRNCIQMTSTLPGSEAGKWIDAYCSVRNVFVCQKIQQFSLNQLQEIVFEQKRKLDLLEGSIIPVPIGFIYVQFPNQALPKTLWPRFSWEDISSSFSGSFFRAHGGTSGSFGSTQSESSPHLEQAKYHDGEEEIKSDPIPLSKGSWSNAAWVGAYSSASDRIGLRFYLGNSEVRPKNMAIKIWKRTG